ncbi:DNA-binding protein [Caballeronia pedi]|uniref:DNA-binding protein n=1 Tax=Caballeronia pedi TaxID=1777141 RepID=A0A157ZRV5_9BURK|nr:GntR family transcriptional regulator [Caballeronia pedi]SAK48189.1 DNA-binding protein [Caballeronia pedi]
MLQDKLEHQNLNDRTYALLKGGLISGSFHPGQVFIIRSLAERYGISTTPVREALQRLVAERLLVMLPNRSIVVPTLSPTAFGELYRIRFELEGLAAQMATRFFKASDVARLKKLLASMDGAIERGDKTAYRELNEKFHFAIYERANSPRLLEMIQGLWGQVGPVFYGLLEDPDYGGEHANVHHRELVEAIEAGDEDAVRQKLVEDLVAAENALISRLQSLVSEGVEAGLPTQAETEPGTGVRKLAVTSVRQPLRSVAPRKVGRS